MKKNKITKEQIISLIKQEAEDAKRKKEIYSEVIKYNNELKNIYENRGITGTFGFVGDDSSKSISGFKEIPNISYVAYLEKEFAKEDAAKAKTNLSEDELNEMTKLKEENKTLKNRLNNIEEALKSLNTKEPKK